MTEVHIVRVFTNEQSHFGNLASIVFDIDNKLSVAERQALTRRIGHEETLFINKLAPAEVSIFNPQQEVKFAGPVTVGAAWLLNNLANQPIDTIHCLDGNIRTWQAERITWVQAAIEMMPPWQYLQLDSPQSVVNFSAGVKELEHTFVWAWLDEAAGLVQARTFAPDWEIPEAEANGSGSMLLAAKLSRKLEVRHGKGSVIYAEPADNNLLNVGGRVVPDTPIYL